MTRPYLLRLAAGLALLLPAACTSPAPPAPNLTALFERLEQRLGAPLLTIGCDCFLRRLEVEERGLGEAASELLRRQQVIGFNTYGEQYNGMHINQTFTGVAIGQPRARRGH